MTQITKMAEMRRDMETTNAKISGTSLGVAHTDRRLTNGVLSFYIQLDFGVTTQGFGGWALDTVNPAYEQADVATKRDMPVRVPTNLASSLLLGVHRVFGVDWEELKGLPCRAARNERALVALGHYLDDKWLWMDKEAGEFSVTKLANVETRIVGLVNAD
jgi:hypothetical protein